MGQTQHHRTGHAARLTASVPGGGAVVGLAFRARMRALARAYLIARKRYHFEPFSGLRGPGSVAPDPFKGRAHEIIKEIKHLKFY